MICQCHVLSISPHLTANRNSITFCPPSFFGVSQVSLPLSSLSLLSSLSQLRHHFVVAPAVVAEHHHLERFRPPCFHSLLLLPLLGLSASSLPSSLLQLQLLQL
eukprot:c27101_g1_i1.p2 GENE.c27101_g1_i1~~c27101_g1_i1.p2  ORF type:complete len:104 (-),score=23.91 c27101_g1_i1:47-358(-)